MDSTLTQESTASNSDVPRISQKNWQRYVLLGASVLLLLISLVKLASVFLPKPKMMDVPTPSIEAHQTNTTKFPLISPNQSTNTNGVPPKAFWNVLQNVRYTVSYLKTWTISHYESTSDGDTLFFRTPTTSGNGFIPSFQISEIPDTASVSAEITLEQNRFLKKYHSPAQALLVAQASAVKVHGAGSADGSGIATTIIWLSHNGYTYTILYYYRDSPEDQVTEAIINTMIDSLHFR